MTGILNHAEFMDNPPIACWSIYRSSVAVDTNEPLLLSDLSFKCQGCVILKIHFFGKQNIPSFALWQKQAVVALGLVNTCDVFKAVHTSTHLPFWLSLCSCMSSISSTQQLCFSQALRMA